MRKMRWHLADGATSRVLQVEVDGQWRHYAQHPLAVPDHRMKTNIGSASKGFATMQRLLREGYTLVKDDD